jgi:hypothetical protein
MELLKLPYTTEWDLQSGDIRVLVVMPWVWNDKHESLQRDNSGASFSFWPSTADREKAPPPFGDGAFLH